MYAAAQEAGIETSEQYTDALKDLVDQQREAAGVVLSLRDAQRNLEQSIADASQALTDNGATLDITTEKGRANQAALDDVASAGWDVIASMRENGSTQEELQAQMQTTRDRFLSVATQMGMSADEANRLADELGLIPSTVDVQVAVDTASAQRDADAFITRNNGRVISFQGRVTEVLPGQAGANRAMATGGAVVGPGNGTSDSIPAWLSNGEWVIKASSVAKYGHAFMSSLNAGTLPRFAGGGQVHRYATAPSAAPVMVSAPTARGGQSITVGQIVTADPREAMREMAATLRMEMAGRL